MANIFELGIRSAKKRIVCDKLDGSVLKALHNESFILQGVTFSLIILYFPHISERFAFPHWGQASYWRSGISPSSNVIRASENDENDEGPIPFEEICQALANKSPMLPNGRLTAQAQ